MNPIIRDREERKLFEKLGYDDKPARRTPLTTKEKIAEQEWEQSVIKQMEAEMEAEILATPDLELEETTEKIEVEKKRELYTDDLDKQIREMDTNGSSIAEIAKVIGRSYASAMYRVRKLRNESE